MKLYIKKQIAALEEQEDYSGAIQNGIDAFLREWQDEESCCTKDGQIAYLKEHISGAQTAIDETNSRWLEDLLNNIE